MGPKTKQAPESLVREIKRNTRRKFSSEEKIRIILEGLQGEDSIANICRKEDIAPSIYYKWSKAFLEAGKRKLNSDTIREDDSNEVSDLRQEELGSSLWRHGLQHQARCPESQETGDECRNIGGSIPRSPSPGVSGEKCRLSKSVFR